MFAVSVIVPSFKRIDQTLKTLTLIKESAGKGKEFVLELIVSDSTPDESLKNQVQEVFGNQVVYTKPKTSGIAANKNQGARIARHPIIIFCDSDMEVEPETFINTLNSLKKHPTAAAVGGKVIWKGGEKNGQLDRPRPEDSTKTIGQTTYIEALYSRYLATYKDIFWQVGGYDEEVFNMRGEGADLSIRYWRAGFPLVYDTTVKVHHVHDAPESAALRVAHPEWGIAKDLLLLGYKYSMFGFTCPNFSATIAANFRHLGSGGYYCLLEGIGKHMDFITTAKSRLDEFRQHDQPRYDFKFLEIISREDLFNQCVENAVTLITAAKKQV
ncbi:MAG: glycosyltransferase [Patescibacteria group bacterium]